MIRFAGPRSGDFGMTDSKDNWPEYNPGNRKHIHAIGILANSYNEFESGLLVLYRHHLKRIGLPDDLVDMNYLNLPEERRPRAIKAVFAKYESDDKIKSLIGDLNAYFSWCWDVRNKLLHSVSTPAFFVAAADYIYLTKRIDKKSPEKLSISLSLPRLRELADAVEIGNKLCLDLNTFLYLRDTPKENWQSWARGIAGLLDPLPQTLSVPSPLEGSALGSIPSKPSYLHKP